MKSQSPEQLPPVRVRPRLWYRAAYVWAGIGIGWLLISGRFVSWFRPFQFRVDQPPPANDTDSFVTAVVWMLAIAPLLLLAYDLGSQHVEARRLGTSVWRGLRETWRVAWQRARPDEMAADFSVTPDDDISAAMLQGIAFGAMPLAFFLGAVPSLRTPPGVIWIGGTSVLIGVTAYCRRRAAAYLRDDPGSWRHMDRRHERADRRDGLLSSTGSGLFTR